MCPACYINGLLFLIFGASISIIDNPWALAVTIVSIMIAFYWMYKAYKKNKGKGGFVKNLKTTLIYLLIFAGGFVTAAYVTHDYFKSKYEEVVTQLPACEHKH